VESNRLAADVLQCVLTLCNSRIRRITNGGEVDHYILGRGGERTLWRGGQATPLALRGGGGNCCRCFGN
jgi:hypothetical protein